MTDTDTRHAPMVSIGLPVRNGADYLAATIDSLLNQSFEDFELIICDNASTDGTAALAERYAQRDSRIRYVRNPVNIGANRNFNRTITLARGTYFKWMGHDDLCATTYLAHCVAALEDDPTAVLCHSRTRYIDENGADLIYDPVSGLLVNAARTVSIQPADPIFAQGTDPVERFEEALSMIVTCHHAFGLMRMTALRRSCGLAGYYGADRALLIEMALYGRFREIPELLFLKREHPRNSRGLSGKDRAQWTSGSALGARFIRLREYAHLLRIVRRSPLGANAKARCLGFAIGKRVRRIWAPAAAADQRRLHPLSG